MATPVAVWAPAFAPLLDRVTVANSQDVFKSGPWCRLCECHNIQDRVGHARAHDRELQQWRKRRATETRREAERVRAEVNAERAFTRRAIAA